MRVVQKGAFEAKQTVRTHILKNCRAIQGNSKTSCISPARANTKVEIYLQVNMFTPHIMIYRRHTECRDIH